MKIFIQINSIVFFLYGVGFVLFPENLSQIVTETTPASTSGLIDMRATYGGMSVAFALLLAYMTRAANTLRLGVVAVVLMMSGMALGRMVGMVLDGAPNNLMYIYLFLELLMIGIGARFLSKKG